MQKYKILIKGKSPYMQSKFDDVKFEEWERSHGSKTHREKMPTDKKIAMYCMYINEDGIPYIPASHLFGSLREGGAFMKIKIGATRKSLKTVGCSLVSIQQEEIPILPDPNNWIVDKRMAKTTRDEAINVRRPKWKDWEAEFILDVEPEITQEILQEWLSYAGKFAGIGSYRPHKSKGPFGRYEVISIEEMD